MRGGNCRESRSTYREANEKEFPCKPPNIV
jgi:hypothetical protein